ncbi:hypothetical protein EZV62_011841 [Acer yangbiense]|uniref:CCHC-type domain-containing protein n=1 Tax=Acer yangbiense TaxID=1000413 RepID=A0A5C7I6M9_9ROSI|nr:hypothetical protein EZV62_011841 [Acer yangbiense]
MSAADLAELCENLSLTDEDGAILEIIEEAELEGEEDVDHNLVGRVLSGKKVNKEVFKSLIDQLWNPFGNVEIELIGENAFMFHFVNRDERNRFWHRGPWHFGRSLIVLEKPVGFGDVSKLGFNKAEFWVQIHDIPIMCMNRRTAKWLAEQIGAVVELSADSRECRDEIAVVGLKYERLPDFCYMCGRVGHVLKECTDEEAKQGGFRWFTYKVRSVAKNARGGKGEVKISSIVKWRIGKCGSGSERGGEDKGPIIMDSVMPESNSGPLKVLTTYLSEKPGRMLEVGKGARRVSSSQNSSPSGRKKSQGKEVSKTKSKSLFSPIVLSRKGGIQLCKRKVIFETSEVTKELKKGRVSSPVQEIVISVEPGYQGRRKQ